MNKISKIILLFTIFIFSCGEKHPPQQAHLQQKPATKSVVEKQKEQTIELTGQELTEVFKKYTYEGLGYRDPFLPVSGEKIAKAKLGLTKDAVVPPLGSLQLKGFIIDKKDNIALFSSPYGSYLLVNGKLYDNQNRVVRGFSGKIIFDPVNRQPNSVIIITENNEYKEYKLRE